MQGNRLNQCIWNVTTFFEEEKLSSAFMFRSPQEFISVTYLQDKLKHATDLNNLPKLGKKNIEKSYSRIEKSLTKLSTMCVQH